MKSSILNKFNFLILAGIGNSGVDHWQSLWAAQYLNARWVEHQDWENPVCDEWVKDLENVLQYQEKPVLVIAHSLGCLLFLEWARQHHTSKVVGAFLVAVPDPTGTSFPSEAIGFCSSAGQTTNLPPVMVIASENDPYGGLEYAKTFAHQCGGSFFNAGLIGNINSRSGLGTWPEGLDKLTGFVTSLCANT